MRILVTGASGFLGHHLVRHLESEHDVAACWNEHPVTFKRAGAVRMDFTDQEQCREAVASFSPTHIVHAGAMTQTGACESHPDKAWSVNVEGTRNILEALTDLAPASPPHLVFLSTDLVFNGRKPGGRYMEEGTGEDDSPDPLMAYGRTKLDAEGVLAAGTRGEGGVPVTILRSALIYGPPTAPRPCFLDWMLKGISQGSGALFTDEYRSPVFVEDLCRVIETACLRRARGIYHVGGPDRISRYELGLLAAEIFGLPRENVRGVPSAQGPATPARPADVSMDIGKARRELDYTPRSCRQGLADLFRAGQYASLESV